MRARHEVLLQHTGLDLIWSSVQLLHHVAFVQSLTYHLQNCGALVQMKKGSTSVQSNPCFQ